MRNPKLASVVGNSVLAHFAQFMAGMCYGGGGFAGLWLAVKLLHLP